MNRILKEQARCRDYILNRTGPDIDGAWRGLGDWVMEEILGANEMNETEQGRKAGPVLNLRQLQVEHREWSQDNFGNYEPWRPLLGAMEELGELAHAHLKLVDGIRGTAEFHQAAAADAVGDIVLFLAGYCTASGLDFQQVVEQTWAHVKTRNWKQDPLRGVTATEHKATGPTK